MTGFFINPFNQTPPPIDLDQLLAYYKFNTTSGGLLNKAVDVGSSDEITNSDGTVTGATTTTGLIGNAYDFDGIDDKVEMASSQASWKIIHDGTTDWSINFWMKLNATDPDNLQIMISNSNLDVEPGFGIFLDDRSSVPNDHKLRLLIGNASTSIDFSSSSVYIPKDTTTFHMYTVTYTIATQIVNIYRDGDANNESEDFTFTESTANAAQLLNIGTRASADDFDLDAILDEMSIWGRLLTAQERTDLYNSGLPSTHWQTW